MGRSGVIHHCCFGLVGCNWLLIVNFISFSVSRRVQALRRLGCGARELCVCSHLQRTGIYFTTNYCSSNTPYLQVPRLPLHLPLPGDPGDLLCVCSAAGETNKMQQLVVSRATIRQRVHGSCTGERRALLQDMLWCAVVLLAWCALCCLSQGVLRRSGLFAVLWHAVMCCVAVCTHPCVPLDLQGIASNKHNKKHRHRVSAALVTSDRDTLQPWLPS